MQGKRARTTSSGASGTPPRRLFLALGVSHPTPAHTCLAAKRESEGFPPLPNPQPRFPGTAGGEGGWREEETFPFASIRAACTFHSALPPAASPSFSLPSSQSRRGSTRRGGIRKGPGILPQGPARPPRAPQSAPPTTEVASRPGNGGPSPCSPLIHEASSRTATELLRFLLGLLLLLSSSAPPLAALLSARTPLFPAPAA